MVTAHLDALPSTRPWTPKRCYLSWSLSLLSDAPETAIREVFEWLNADCELTRDDRQQHARARRHTSRRAVAPAPVAVQSGAAAAAATEPAQLQSRRRMPDRSASAWRRSMS